MNIGIVGGSFDPIHTAHLIIAEAFAEEYELDTCFIVPTAVSPFKTQVYTSDNARLDMLRLAFLGNTRFVIDDREIRRGGASYSIDTILEYKSEFPGDNIYFLLGSDAASGFMRWRLWREILSLVRVCMVLRPLAQADELSIGIDKAYFSTEVGGRPPIYAVLDKFSSILTAHGISSSNLPLPIVAPLMEISSTDIRRRVADGRSIRYLTPDSVRNYIQANNLYKNP